MQKKIGFFVLGVLFCIFVGVLSVFLLKFLSGIKSSVIFLFPLILFIGFAIILWKYSRRTFVGYITGFLILLVVIGLFNLFLRNGVQGVFKEGEEVVAKLNEFKSNYGHYPDALDKIAFKSSEKEIFYKYDADKDSFWLSYKVGFDSYFYNSETDKWSGDLPPGGIPEGLIQEKN